MATTKPTDEQILAAMAGHGGSMTYVIGSRLRDRTGGPDTAFILRRLKTMEKAGRVKRICSSYQVQLCWAVVEGGVL